MSVLLSTSEIEKYAARLQGQRLLPFLRVWQLKRAIRRLAADGTRLSLEALKDGVHKGLLSRPPYTSLLEDVLSEQLDKATAMRVRAHLRSRESPQQKKPQPKPPQQKPVEQKPPAPQAQPEQASRDTEINVPRSKALPKEETFTSTDDPIRLLKQKLSASIAPSLYRVELKQRVRWDTSRVLLQQICELWDKSREPQKSELRDLIEFIELVPERPLWLRRNVALDCGMAWQLLDDSPAIAQHLVTNIQFRTRKEEILNLVRRLRRDDTKAEICSLWYDEHRRGLSDPDFDAVLRAQDYLPQSPLEQRVAIALACGWGERLAFDGVEILSIILPLRDHPTLGQEVEAVLASLKNPATLQALRDLINASTNTEIETNSKDEDHETGDAVTSNGADEPAVQVEEADPQPAQVAPPTERNHKPTLKPFDELFHEPEDDGIWLTSHPDGSTEWDDDSLTLQRLANIDRLANLSPDERQKIISKLVTDSEDHEDWINDLLADEIPLPQEDVFKEPQDSAPTSKTDSKPDASIRAETDRHLKIPRDKDEVEAEARLKTLLARNGLTHAFDAGSIIISARINGEQTEVDRIEPQEIVGLSKEELRNYVKSCSTQLLDSMVERDRKSRTVEQPVAAEREEKPSAPGDLCIDQLDEAELDSASAVLVKCASDLIAAKASHNLAPFCELTAGLLVFHARERDAEIKAYKERLAMNEEALRKDSDCIVGAELEDIVPLKEGIVAARYSFDPCQPFRLSTQAGQRKVTVICQASQAVLNIVSIDETKGIATAEVKSHDRDRLLSHANLIHVPQDFSSSLRLNLAKQARKWANDHVPLPAAFNHLLSRRGSSEITALNQSIDQNPANNSALISHFLGTADGTSLVIQGPPGSGKTTCAAEIIVALAQQGHKIGISAQSHLAIDTLLAKASAIAQAQAHQIRFAKYKNSVTSEERKELSSKGIQIIDSRTFSVLHDVYGGTAHAFSGSLFDELFDLLIVDEASQVSLASLLAMARSARNLLLVGDQQQLAQPIIAEHPGECGLSCLSYATSCEQLVPRNIGIFLSKSWRLHPHVCRFISDTFYGGQLGAHSPNEANKISLINAGHGILYLPTDHDLNHVFSEEEAESIKAICNALLGLECLISANGKLQPIVIGWEHIAIMAPYNAQVSLLQRALGPDARVGTVDKFQGQEAPVAIYSLTSSNAENPAAIDFVLNRNRVNVAISRSQCLSIVVGSPSLTSILNASPELQEARDLFFAISEFLGSASSLTFRSTAVGTPVHPRNDSQNAIFNIGDMRPGPDEQPATIPNDLADPLNNRIARKLFKFELGSEEILDLYKYRLLDELRLFLDFCRWDETEKAWERTKVLLRLAKSPIATPVILERLAKRGDGTIRQAVAANPNTSLAVIRQLMARESVMGRRGAAENPSLPAELYHELFHAGADELTHRALAHNPSTPDNLLHKLADSEHDLTQAGAVKALADRAIASSLKREDKDTKPAQAEPYSLEHDSQLEIARNPSVPASFLSTLVTSANQRIRTALASNPSLATGDIETLALDSNDSVRCELALRPDLPAQVTSEMAFDKSRFVRRNLASNPSCSDAAFKRLAADKDVYVRENLARNPALSSRASSWLLADTESRVFLAHADNTSIASDVFIEARKTYYKDSLASDKDSALKALLLLHPNCPLDHLEGITIKNDLPVRLAIALSPHASMRALKLLTKDKDPEIAKIAQRRLSD